MSNSELRTPNSDKPNMPRHIGFILDGNRRWAASRDMKPIDGHKEGYAVLKDIARACFDAGAEYVTAFVFSTENWKRSEREVNWLMNFAQWAADNEVDDLAKDGIRLRILGTDDRVGTKLANSMHKAEEKLSANQNKTLALCFNYGGRQEIIDATKKIIQAGINPADLSEGVFSQYLYGPDIPDVDLMIRTSGEKRISNFMLWRLAYAELEFVPMHWPDFTVANLQEVLDNYSKRERRIGK